MGLNMKITILFVFKGQDLQVSDVTETLIDWNICNFHRDYITGAEIQQQCPVTSWYFTTLKHTEVLGLAVLLFHIWNLKICLCFGRRMPLKGAMCSILLSINHSTHLLSRQWSFSAKTSHQVGGLAQQKRTTVNDVWRLRRTDKLLSSFSNCAALKISGIAVDVK